MINITSLQDDNYIGVGAPADPQIENNTSNNKNVPDNNPTQWSITYDPATKTANFGSLEGAPFNDFTNGLRALYDGSFIIGNATYNKPFVASSLVDIHNYYYQAYNSGENKNGRVKSTSQIHKNWKNSSGDIAKIKSNMGDNYAKDPIFKNTPAYSVVPSCRGSARGRLQELLQQNHSKGLTNDYNEPFSKTKNYEVYPGFKLWKDTEGEYGPKDGLWGSYSWDDPINPQLLPGCIIRWDHIPGSSDHTAFVEAVYNIGKKDEYAIISNSSFGVYKIAKQNERGLLTCIKIPKYSGTASTDKKMGYFWYLRSSNYWKPKYLYTPLCNYDVTINNNITPVGKMISIDYTKPAEEQLANYEIIKAAIAANGVEIKAGNKVEIQWIGNLEKDGTGKKVNRLYGQGWVKKVHNSANAYPYEVVDKQTGGSLIAFYDRKSLKLL